MISQKFLLVKLKSKCLNFERNVDVRFYFIPFPDSAFVFLFLTCLPLTCGSLLWMAPYTLTGLTMTYYDICSNLVEP